MKHNNKFILVLIYLAFFIFFIGIGGHFLQRGCASWASMEALSRDAQCDVALDLIIGIVFVLGFFWMMLDVLAKTCEKTPKSNENMPTKYGMEFTLALC